MTAATASADDSSFNVPFEEAIRYLRQKVNLPSKTWRDIEGRAHDRSFVIAGAMKDGLLADLKAEIEKGVRGENTLAGFAKSFEEIVARHGWTGWTGEGSEAGRAWRTRVIYETNLKTAYAAGRYAQMTDPKIVKLRKWWRYRHGYYRTPERPRPEHVAFDGRVLAWDDPWWDVYYPPNGWECSCGVETLTDRDLQDEGVTPEESPPIATRMVVDPKTGEKLQVPRGIDFGWDHAPGRDWSRGLVPRELQQPLRDPEEAGPVLPHNLPPLVQTSKPFAAGLLPDDIDPKEAAEKFLQAFGASWDTPAMFRDAAGHAIGVSKSLFADGMGEFKGGKASRHLQMLRLAEALRDPDEIWVDWQWNVHGQQWGLVRNYLRLSPDLAGFALFRWSSAGWEGATAFGATNKGKVYAPYLERQRHGALLYRRKMKGDGE